MIVFFLQNVERKWNPAFLVRYYFSHNNFTFICYNELVILK